jgi:diacylglycerol kinase (ATP)
MESSNSSEDSLRTIAKSLRRNQRKHAELLDKVEKSTARLQRRKSNLQILEALIADEERRLSEPRKENAGRQDGDGPFRHARLIFNPTSGRGEEDSGERLAEVVSALRAHGIEPHVGVKTSGKAARELARKAVKAGHPLVIVAAGDGTIAEVAAQLIGSSTALGIVPIGTMNNVARSLGIPLTIDDACALIGMGTTRHIDVGRVVANGPAKSEVFLECAGVGLTSILAAAGQSVEKHRWSHLPSILRRFTEDRLGVMKIELDDMTIEAHSRMVTVSNSPLLGNNLLAAPGAKMDDGMLDVRVYDGMGDVDLAKHFASASSGNAIELKSYRTRRVRITAEDPVVVNSDMVITGPRRIVEIEAVPGALSMIVGNGMALSVPVESAPKANALGPAAPPHPNGSSEAVVEDANAKK